MHQTGVDEIRAAVVKQAIEDYCEACKVIIAFSGEFTGQNVKRSRDSKMKKFTGEYIKKPPADKSREEWIKNRINLLTGQAKADVHDVEEFFTGQRFQVFADSITGQKILDASRQYMKAWAEDKNSGRLPITVRLSSRKYMDSIKDGTGYWKTRKPMV